LEQHVEVQLGEATSTVLAVVSPFDWGNQWPVREFGGKIEGKLRVDSTSFRG